MSSATLNSQWVWRGLWLVLGVAVVAVTTAALVPPWRVALQARMFPDQKRLLATVSGDLLGSGALFKVLKFSTGRGLIVEVHEPVTGAERPYQLVDRIFIPDRHDGFFSLNNIATRLALVDVDRDGRPEIIAPSFDEKLAAHLNTLRLDPDTRRLEIVRPQTPAQ